MTATMHYHECIGSRSGQASLDRSSEINWKWAITGNATLYSEVIPAIDAYVPAAVIDPWTGQTLLRQQTTWENPNIGAWTGQTKYIDAMRADDINKLDVGDTRVKGSSTGGKVRILLSKQTIASYKRADDPNPIPDQKGAINVTRDNEVQGVEIVVPDERFTVSARIARATATRTYFVTVMSMTGTTNNAICWGFPIGELLFLGIDFTEGLVADPQFDLHFLRCPNLSGLTIGGITGVAKKGHEYMWIKFEEVSDATSKTLLKKPKNIYIERLYDAADFSAFGVGTT